MPLDIKGNILSSTDITSVGVFKTHINRDGLICYLDAGDKDSYPGTGTVWYDLSGNGYNGYFTGGTTFNSATNSGVIVTDGSTGYVRVPVPDLTSTNFTVMGAAKYDTGNHGRIIQDIGNNWLLGWWSSSTENFYSVGWVTPSGTGTNDTNWRINACTGDISNHTYNMFVNGVGTTMGSTAGTAGPNGIALGGGGGYSAEWSNSFIGYLLVYNRVLSPYEIAENFQATKGRFGL